MLKSLLLDKQLVNSSSIKIADNQAYGQFLSLKMEENPAYGQFSSLKMEFTDNQAYGQLKYSQT